MTLSLRYLIVLTILLSCEKQQSNGTVTYTHTFPTQADKNKEGVTELSLGSRSYFYFSNQVFTKLPTDFWFYHAVTDTWIPKADFPGKDRITIHLHLANQSVYAGLSKVNTPSALKDWFQYDTTANTWAQKASLPYRLPSSMEITKASNASKIVFGCAYDLTGTSLCPLVYNVTNNSWSRDNMNCDSVATSCF